ncbi:NAD-dependent succinate-semialdehyde dehydrogenase [Pusillimonas sp.]|uniref:NAD-dependent succinate-semialdehyde dehydrogenase n=1 Tax=Pusillimonas sp. TaxID=3040095 RepID=UPI0029A1306E|nr:NAD-dependent succinate-semialdehyde dehydrogenase [Pusillimonas sp.]MDX3894634.1 NAD-dependent succinate-semialdehyde dehydrogenase [Pusillimonas sp.]
MSVAVDPVQSGSALEKRLQDPDLLRDRNLVDGAWCASASGRSHPVLDPSTGELLADVPFSESIDAERGIGAARGAFHSWSRRTAKERSALIRRWYELIMSNKQDLGSILSSEQGKPLSEAVGEVAFGASYVEWYAEEAKRAYGEMIPTHAADKRLGVIKQPVGVAALITPWNFPSAMITRKAAPALAAGCTVVIKPAEDTPLSALALGELAQRAGIPPGVINIITTGDPAPIGDCLTSHPEVRKLSFTGSTRVGKLLMSQCASTIKKVSLELGGNAPFIVFDDADLDAAVAGLMVSKYRNTGQTCISANRIFVQAPVFDRFLEKLEAEVSRLKVGGPFESGVDQGPLINQAALDKVKRLVKDAMSRGAQAVTGARVHGKGGLFYEPTILKDVPEGARILGEEVFGPVASLIRFTSESEVVAMANDTSVGLAGYFYSRDIGRIWRVAEALEVGMVGINEGMISSELIPFGGIKESGIGREGSRHGLDDFLEFKYLCFGGI